MLGHTSEVAVLVALRTVRALAALILAVTREPDANDQMTDMKMIGAGFASN